MSVPNETVETEVVAPVEGAAIEETVEEIEETKTFDAEYVKSLRKEAARYRTENKELSEKAKAFDEWNESQKSEQQKKDEALAAAQSELAQMRSELLRSKVASKKQLPPSLVARLKGETEEELEADADALLADLKDQYAPKQKSSPEQTGAGVVGESEGITPESYTALLAQRG